MAVRSASTVLGGSTFPPTRLFILALRDRGVAALAAGLQVHLARPPHPRDGAEPDLAERAGISTRAATGSRSSSAPASPGVAGVALTLMGSICPTWAPTYIINAFLVVVVGGIGQIKGTRDRGLRARHRCRPRIEYTTTASASPR